MRDVSSYIQEAYKDFLQKDLPEIESQVNSLGSFPAITAENAPEVFKQSEDTALNFANIGGAVRGLKRVPALYHGTLTQDRVADILSGGFKEGANAELRAVGTSASKDPLVSLDRFAPSPSMVVRVFPTVGKEAIENLSPSKYLMRESKGPISSIPNMFLAEDELFGHRASLPGSQAPFIARLLTEHERNTLMARAAETQKAADDLVSMDIHPVPSSTGHFLNAISSAVNVLRASPGMLQANIPAIMRRMSTAAEKLGDSKAQSYIKAFQDLHEEIVHPPLGAGSKLKINPKSQVELDRAARIYQRAKSFILDNVQELGSGGFNSLPDSAMAELKVATKIVKDIYHTPITK